MSTRSSTADKLLRTPFRSRTRVAQQAQAAEERARHAESEQRVARLAERARPLEDAPAAPADATAAPVDDPELQSELGEATYQCGCGYVFQAEVLTSVACPHCGDSQAW